MTVEERRYGNGMGNDHVPKFPIGMRVLAVDDDPTCLKMLEGLLRRCKYHVTTTDRAIKALNMLRERKDDFDLVISDVHMPDMDGFKLLELVGLEMDLPVIMLSANSDPNSVMKGINHGACDYLLKPVRLEELKNIWTHVYRKRNKESSHNNCDEFDDDDGGHAVNSSEAGSAGVVTGPDNRGSSKPSRKRHKDQYDEDDAGCGECGEENGGGGHENDDSSSGQNKKPRVVWSVELHKKFVWAVNQLGLDRAMPKKILDLMNVEKLTRENVASHLQKYRLYLKRIDDQKQEAKFATALNAARGAASYLQMGQLDLAARNYHGFSAAAAMAAGHHLSAPVQLTQFHQQAAALGRMNSLNCSGAAAAYGLGGSSGVAASGGIMQLGRTQSSISNTSSHFQDLGSRLPQINFGGTPRPNLLQGIPTSLESSQLLNDRILLQPNNIASSSGAFPDPDMSYRDMGSSFNLGATTNNQLMIPNQHQQQQQQQQRMNGFGTQISAELPALSINQFEIGAGASSTNLPSINGCNATWQGPAAAPLTNMLPITACDLGETFSSVTIAPDSNSNGNIVHSINSLTSAYTDSMVNQAIPLEGNSGIMHGSVSGESSFLHANNTANLGTGWNDQRRNQPVGMFQPASGSGLSNVTTIPNVATQAFNHGLFETNPADMPPVNNQSSRFVAELPYPQNMGQQSQGYAAQSQMKSRDEYNTAINDAYNIAHANMFEELMHATFLLPDNDGGLADGDIGTDMHSLGTCM